MPELTSSQWIWITTAALAIGFSKMGISAVVTMIIPFLAGVFGSRESTGIMLPLLLVGDVMAVSYYRRSADWKAIRRLLPWTLAGLAIGAVIGYWVSDRVFKLILGISVLLCTGLLAFTETRGNRFQVPNATWFYCLTGILGGFTTMIGNAAGPIMSIYLFAMGYQKNNFIGTYAWFFMIINAIKVPLQVFIWHNITTQHAVLALCLIPIIALGALLGVWVVKRIPEKPFRYLIIVMTGLSAIRLLI